MHGVTSLVIINCENCDLHFYLEFIGSKYKSSVSLITNKTV